MASFGKRHVFPTDSYIILKNQKKTLYGDIMIVGDALGIIFNCKQLCSARCWTT